MRPYALLGGLCLLLYLPGMAAIPPLDRDEARFAQATRQMLETGDYLRIRFQDEARNKKPAGIYWLQAAAVSAFSTPASAAIWPYRVPSLVGAMVAALLTFALGSALFRGAAAPPAPRRVGMIAAVLLASALGVVAEALYKRTERRSRGRGVTSGTACRPQPPSGTGTSRAARARPHRPG